eukprot:CAMPEP_0113569914 /NCGR_PEP_ID=MMETSP0015_2-20120614/24675_1 /TAXON_ID=2838 /ORGANISM="Odontella" /LENGTH=396 /DNA_ID=CAMNT_0000472631 /DNA_START=449 /DNA_END=1639 /DNA_ORIENTATION=- /assembly_acc=CAM_ASM_000160
MTRSNLAAAAAAAAACALSMACVGPQHATLVVSAFAPSKNAFVSLHRPLVSASASASASPTAAWMSSVVDEAPSTAAASASASAAAEKPKPKKNRRRSGKSTKVTPAKASANGKSAPKKNGKRAKTGKRGKRGKFFKKNNANGNGNGKKYTLDNKSSIDRNDLLPLSKLKPGQRITGYVAAITDFGAFVKTPYKLEGGGGRGSGYALLHISQISDERVSNVTDVLEVGQELKDLRVIDINYAKGEVGLSLRSRRPPRFPLSVVRRGEEMEGKVTSVVPYGAFVDVGCKVNALLHVSRMSTEEVRNVEDYARVGQFLKVHIIDVDKDKRTLACSILDAKADEYLDRRKRQMERKAESKNAKKNEGNDKDDDKDDKTELQTELAYFEEALQELENAFK